MRAFECFYMALAAASVTAEDLQLPPAFGDFKLVEHCAASLGTSDKKLLEEYGLRVCAGAKYTNARHQPMEVGGCRFENSLSAHAAFLALRPNQGVSPMIWKIEAVTGSGSTVLEYKNYVFRFAGALPTVSSALEDTLAKLPHLTMDEKPWDLSGRYLDAGSTRMILGPVSLARFAEQIPPSVVAFRLGAIGRFGSFETPAGRITTIVFEYPSEAIANEQLSAIQGLQKTSARRDRTCVGVILTPPDAAAGDSFADHFCGPVTVEFDDAFDLDGGMTLDGGIWWVMATGVLGAVFALVRSMKGR